jgi:formylglycine-generating enzyme required for sulfatase activity
VSGFRLDKYEVTVGRFRTFFAAWTAGWRPAAGSGKHVHLNGGLGLANGASPGSFEAGWTGPSASDIAPDRSNEREVPLTDATLACSDGIIDDLGGSRFDTWTPSVGPNENRPVNCIDWHDAYAFCIWDGGFLPSEAEWEYAAAGGAEQRAYAWGSTPPGIANDFEIYECHFPRGRRGHLDACASNGNIAPVGTAREGAGRWGQLDLLGNLSEYALDFWNESYVNPCTDCGYLYPTPGVATPGITIRGGSFDAKDYMPPSRNFNGRVYRNTSLGFRCARTP